MEGELKEFVLYMLFDLEPAELRTGVMGNGFATIQELLIEIIAKGSLIVLEF